MEICSKEQHSALDRRLSFHANFDDSPHDCIALSQVCITVVSKSTVDSFMKKLYCQSWIIVVFGISENLRYDDLL